MAGTRDLAYLCRQMKAPSLLGGVERLGARAREEARSHEEFLAACLEREVSARASHGGQARIRAARFPARKTLEDFDFDHQRSVRSEVVAHLGPWTSSRPRPTHLLGATGHGQDAPLHCHRSTSGPGRLPGGLRHRHAVGGPTGSRP